jgi:hypothetical protein
MKKLPRKIGTAESSDDLRAQLLRAERDAICSGELWDEAGVVDAELRIDRLKAELGETSPGVYDDQLPFG